METPKASPEACGASSAPGCSVSELRKEAEDWVKKHGFCGLMGPFPTRSCWNCNAAHEWMKTDMETPYECYECGHIYFKGVRLTDDPSEPNPSRQPRRGCGVELHGVVGLSEIQKGK